MDKKFFIENDGNKVNHNLHQPTNDVNYDSLTNDRIVSDFLNKNVSLESLIENEIFNREKF